MSYQLYFTITFSLKNKIEIDAGNRHVNPSISYEIGFNIQLIYEQVTMYYVLGTS